MTNENALRNESAFRRILNQLAQVSWTRKLTKLGLLTLFIFSIIAGIYYGNASVGVGFLSMLVILLGMIAIACWVGPFCQYLKYWLREDMSSESAWRRAFPKSTYSRDDNDEPMDIKTALAIFGVPILLVTISACVFVSFPGTSSSDIWVVGNRTTGAKGFIFAMPFVQEIKSVSVRQDQTFAVEAVTADGIPVRGRLNAEIVLREAEVVGTAARHAVPNKGLSAEIQEALGRRFKIEVAKRKLDDLAHVMRIEFDTAQNQAELQRLGVGWDGVLRVDDLHSLGQVLTAK